MSAVLPALCRPANGDRACVVWAIARRRWYGLCTAGVRSKRTGMRRHAQACTGMRRHAQACAGDSPPGRPGQRWGFVRRITRRTSWAEFAGLFPDLNPTPLPANQCAAGPSGWWSDQPCCWAWWRRQPQGGKANSVSGGSRPSARASAWQWGAGCGGHRGGWRRRGPGSRIGLLSAGPTGFGKF